MSYLLAAHLLVMFTTKVYGLLAGIVVATVSAVWLAFSWFEAEKEIEVLCSNFHAGQNTEHVVETLKTGEYLRYRTQATDTGQRMYVDSIYNLGTSNCSIEISGNTVVSSVHTE